MPISQTLHYRIQLLIIDIVVLFCLVQLLAEESDRKIFFAQHTTYAYAGGVTSHLKYLQEIKKAKDWGSSQLLLDLLEGSSSSSSPFELPFLKAFSN